LWNGSLRSLKKLINGLDKEGRKIMVQVIFEFKDEYTHGRWQRQSCTVESLDECIEHYGLGRDCEYRIIDIQEVKNG
jgi:hypothetical protein